MLSPHRKADVKFDKIKNLDEQGHFSTVYLAKDIHLDHEIVIKEIKKKEHENSDKYFSEARILYKHTHPNIVQVHYAAEDENNIYIAMPFYKKGTISSLLSETNLSPREIIRYAIQFIGGLHHIHTNKLMHFDIKPNNIMISNRNEAMLADFGLAKYVNNESLKVRPDQVYKAHTPPELFSIGKDGFTYTYDIYQTGVTLYRMAIGSQKYTEELNNFKNPIDFNESIKQGKFPQKKYPAHIPKKLIKIINKCLEFKPEDRYQSALDILNDLSNIKDTDGTLDWKKVDTNDKNISEWNKDSDDGILKLIYYKNKRETTLYKIKTNGSKRKVGKGCSEKCSESILQKILKEC